MINIYFSDTEAVEACICRLNVISGVTEGGSCPRAQQVRGRKSLAKNIL